jgi:hypothetical protein
MKIKLVKELVVVSVELLVSAAGLAVAIAKRESLRALYVILRGGGSFRL